MKAKTFTLLPLEGWEARPRVRKKPNPHERMDVREAVLAARIKPIKGDVFPFREPRERCGNGSCTKSKYRGNLCYRCWAGVKWTSLCQRLENANGHCQSYKGVPFGFTRIEFLEWVLGNPPPQELETPSIDRIDSKRGYVSGNIRWMEANKNSRHIRKDDPDGLKFCPKCSEFKPATKDFFHGNNTRRNFYKLQSYCKICRGK